MYKEKNTGNNLPAQIELYHTQGNEYHFQFIAKGYQNTRLKIN